MLANLKTKLLKALKKTLNIKKYGFNTYNHL
jgi:hypothetical protein